jgi:hypothetical protein
VIGAWPFIHFSARCVFFNFIFVLHTHSDLLVLLATRLRLRGV